MLEDALESYFKVNKPRDTEDSGVGAAQSVAMLVASLERV